jgi:hypothetical protein
VKDEHFLVVLATGVFLVVIGALLFGCAPEKKVEAAKLSTEALTCRAKISAVVHAAPSCNVAAAGVRALIHEDPACIELFMGHGVDLQCHNEDGGAQ